MGFFAIRLKATKEAVGVVYAETEPELRKVLDERVNPDLCECLPLPAGGFFFKSGENGISLPIKEPLGLTDEQAEKWWAAESPSVVAHLRGVSDSLWDSLYSLSQEDAPLDRDWVDLSGVLNNKT